MTYSERKDAFTLSALVCLTRRENIVCDPELGKDFRDISIFQPISSYFVYLARVGSRVHAMADSDNELVFNFASVIYYVDPNSEGTMGYLESKEWIWIAIKLLGYLSITEVYWELWSQVTQAHCLCHVRVTWVNIENIWGEVSV